MMENRSHADRRQRGIGLEWAAVLLAFLGVALTLFQPVLEAGFVSDDFTIIVTNPYVQELSLENLVAILDPYGPPVGYAMNYSPVHLLLHAVEIELFGDAMYGYHVVNVVLHSVTALLFALLLVSSRIHVVIAAAAGALFLVHPANVEAVAMVFQAKTTLATALAFGALLAFWRHPFLATLLFGLALLAKFTALFALPVLGIMVWIRWADPERDVPHWGWLAAWAVVLLAVAVPEFAAFQRPIQGVERDWLVQGRSIVAIAMRYLVMAATSYGVSVFQQPEPAYAWGNLWWLGGVVALALLAWRSGLALLRREEEAAWWVMAAASFAPISQIFPFIYPLADRYLYTILPGLLGGALLASRAPAARAEAWLRARLGARAPGISLVLVGGVATLLGLAVAFAPRAHEYTRVFRSHEALAAESARSYPNGIQALIRRAVWQAQQGNASAVAKALEEIDRQGYTSFSQLAPHLAAVGADSRVKAGLAHMALQRIEQYEAVEGLFPIELYGLSQAQLELGRLSEAVESLERALQIGGPRDLEFRAVLRRTQAELARQQQTDGLPAD